MSTNARPDVYRRVHRGLRSALFDLGALAGRTLWTDPEDVARLQTSFFDVFEFLKTHGEMEDTHQLPLLESKMPGITDHDREEHEAIEHAIEDVEASLAAAIIAPPEERRAAGESFFHRLNLFIGMYLHHMTHEETVTTGHFHRLCSDDEIADAGRRVVAGLGPERAMRAMRHIIPAMDAHDRRDLVRMVITGMPPTAAQALMELAAETLGAVEYARLVDELEQVSA